MTDHPKESMTHKALQHYSVQMALALSKEVSKTQALLAALDMCVAMLEHIKPVIEDDLEVAIPLNKALDKARKVITAVKQ